VISAQLILVSIGYKSLPVPGLPFDASRGVVPHKAGRVVAGMERNTTNEARQDTTHGVSLTSDVHTSTYGDVHTSTLREESSGMNFERGLYVTGWLKRGPTGIIGTNLIDAEETVGSIAEDEKEGLLPGEDGCYHGG
jgi:hypothetical protein